MAGESTGAEPGETWEGQPYSRLENLVNVPILCQKVNELTGSHELVTIGMLYNL